MCISHARVCACTHWGEGSIFVFKTVSRSVVCAAERLGRVNWKEDWMGTLQLTAKCICSHEVIPFLHANDLENQAPRLTLSKGYK